MALPLTETLHEAASGLDARPEEEILAILLSGQFDALGSVRKAIPQISTAAQLMASAIQSGGRLVYAAAGSSALMANADGLELAGTFGVSPDRVLLLMAGGFPTSSRMPGDTEDDTAEAEVSAKQIQAEDVVIAVTASGGTPYAISIARHAQCAGANTVCIANNRDALIFEHADVAICLPTPPEVIAGSTRMGAGTAQKVALNMMSTLMGIHLGHVFDGMMVNVNADNDKLRARATRMVCDIALVGEEKASDCLARTNGLVKPAVLLAAGVPSLDDATRLLDQTNGHLRAALARV